MRKSIELGRAVLSTSTANFELWLRTLITISPQQKYTNLEQLDASSTLSLLSSGDVWVGRGHGLYIDLDITLRGQHLAGEQLQQLSEAVLEAPAWAQLNLKPSLPCDAVHKPGKLRIMIDHFDDTATLAASQRHRVLSNIPASDVRPPEGISVFSLDSVVLCMDVFELIPRKTAATAKRLKTSTTGNNLSQSMECQYIDNAEHEHTDTLLLSSVPGFSSLSASSTLKRPRAPVSPEKRFATSPIRPPNEDLLGSRLSSQALETRKQQLPPTDVRPTSMQALIDGALRLSILSSINGKTLPGVKVKANTFGTGLADLAPTVWKPGYLS
ncbi:hypothetical protein E8E12_010920 [Didymella heteroderae]|uniref:Uncharacterized protein n=1 Tax=Didymella heteroderae TaxID=1769908 RepID=A0A9P5C4E9_9PLEO|nr:hypothetical protein E8E12_010920 [Didymella heteroderae]